MFESVRERGWVFPSERLGYNDLHSNARNIKGKSPKGFNERQ